MLHTKPQGHWPFWFWRRFLKGFYHIWAWWPSWSHDPDPGNKLSFPHPTEAPYEIWLCLAQRFWRRSSFKMVDDGPWLYYKLTVSSKTLLMIILLKICHYHLANLVMPNFSIHDTKQPWKFLILYNYTWESRIWVFLPFLPLPFLSLISSNVQ